MLKNLKSLFIVDEDDDSDATESSAKGGTATDSSTSSQSASKNDGSSSGGATGASNSGSVNGKIMEKLLAVIEANNQAGFDYLEYKKSIQALEKMRMDEQTRFRSAFATASTVGATRDNLLTSIDLYRKVLENEQSNFVKTLNVQVEEKVSGKQKQVEDLNAQVKSKTDNIKRLTDEIDKHKGDIQGILSKIEEDELKISAMRNDFGVTYDNLVRQMDGDSEKINKYLA